METHDLERSGVLVLLGQEAASIRARFIELFVDTSKQFYRDYIETTKEYSDGTFYTGYLWDVLCDWERVSETDLLKRSLTLGAAYGFWDLHSAEKILTPNYWKFPREAVLEGPANILLSARHLLPKDLYVVDLDFSICLVLTHEYDDDGQDIRLVAWPREQRSGA